MNIVQITPGAGGMYCGNCFRDNALVAELRRQGHQTLMVPLYLPMTLDEADQSQGTPIFFSGVNVYLEQKSAFFRRAPRWLHSLLGSKTVLKWAASRAAKTRAADTGDIMLSMLRGEEGNQARELEELIGWLRQGNPPDVICLSNALLVGLARRLRQALRTPVVCMLQGEDAFLDALPESHRSAAWKLLAARSRDVDLFIAPSHYFAELMQKRLALPAKKVRVVYNGINLDGYSDRLKESPPVPTLGYFARMCREKGLDTLVNAFVILKQRNRIAQLKLRIGGGMGPADEPFVEALRGLLREKQLLADVEFFPNLDRAGKIDFFRSLSIFSVPALYGEAFGLYVLESLAAGVPVVQPRHAAFPELIAATGGGVLCEPGDAESLAQAVEQLLTKTEECEALGQAGRRQVQERFNNASMATEMATHFEEAVADHKLAGCAQP